MTFEEMWNAPKAVRETRFFKHEIKCNCEFIKILANQLQQYADRIPEEDDKDHAALVAELYEHIHSAKLQLDVALEVRHI